jgi:hypothetical protein
MRFRIGEAYLSVFCECCGFYLGQSGRWKKIGSKPPHSRGSDEIVNGRAGSALPVGVKLFADETCVVGFFLGLQGLLEAEQ